MSVLWGILFSNRNCKQIAGSYQYVCVFRFLWIKPPCSPNCPSYINIYKLASFFLSNSVPFSPNSKSDSLRPSTLHPGSASCFFNKQHLISQWPFQEPKLEVPTIYKAYFSGLNFREYPHNSYGLHGDFHIMSHHGGFHIWDPMPSTAITGIPKSFSRHLQHFSTLRRQLGILKPLLTSASPCPKIRFRVEPCWLSWHS